VIEVSELEKRYADVIAVRGVSFRIDSGEVVGLLGPNGAGKTTTMRMLTGYLPPTRGRIVVAGHDMATHAREAHRAIGYLPEVPPLYPEMRVVEYLRFVASIKDVPRAARAVHVERALVTCGLTDVHRKLIGTLSKGYRQRVGLAQAIVHDPAVLVLDEPTAGLDPIQIVEIRALIRALAEEQGRTVILSTHILPEVEQICRRVILIHRGTVRLDDDISDVVARSSLEEVFLREVAGAASDPASLEAKPALEPSRTGTERPSGEEAER
jgi:ABC-2 type transport system ATP-binding protein